MAGSDLDVVIVAFRSRELLPGCLEAVRRLPSMSSVTVVDNGDDDSAEVARQMGSSSLRLDNVGFGTAANRGAAQGLAPFLLILNPDAVVRPEAIEAGLLWLRSQDRVAAAQGAIRSGTAFERASGRSLSPLHLLGRALGLRRALGLPGVRAVARRTSMADHVDRQLTSIRDVEWLAATALLVRRAAFEEILGFDERFFLYAEDDDLCRRLRSRDWRLVALPDVWADHRGGASSAGWWDREVWYWSGALTLAAMWYKTPSYVAARLAAALRAIFLTAKQPGRARTVWRALAVIPADRRRVARRAGGRSESTAATSTSVAMATYNGERFVAEQLRSVLDQTHPVGEIVVHDDGSADGTVRIIEQIAGTTSLPIRVVRHEQRAGAVANFNRALEGTSADVIFLCDQDDVWDREKVARTLASLDAEPGASGVFSDGVLMSADPASAGLSLWGSVGFTGRRLRRWERDQLGVLLRRNVITGATVAIRSRALPMLLPLPAGGWHDLSIGVILAATSRIVALPEPLIRYRVHGGNAAGLPTQSLHDQVVGRDEHLTNLHRQREHWRELVRRLDELGVANDIRVRLLEKIAHLEARAALPPERWRRVRPALRQGARGRYHCYANGWSSLVRDVFGP